MITPFYLGYLASFQSIDDCDDSPYKYCSDEDSKWLDGYYWNETFEPLPSGVNAWSAGLC